MNLHIYEVGRNVAAANIEIIDVHCPMGYPHRIKKACDGRFKRALKSTLLSTESRDARLFL